MICGGFYWRSYSSVCGAFTKEVLNMASKSEDIQNYLFDAYKLCQSLESDISVNDFRIKLNSMFAKRKPQRSLKEGELRNALNWLIEGKLIKFNSDRNIVAVRQLLKFDVNGNIAVVK